MPAPKPRPFDADALRQMYAQGRTPLIIEQYRRVTGLDINKTTVCKWLREAGIERSHFSPYTEKAVPCPYTDARLHEMYWREGMSKSEIARHAADILGRGTLAPDTAGKWLRAAGITLRTAAQSQRVRAKLRPGQFLASIRALRTAHTPETRSAAGKKGARSARHMAKIRPLATAAKKSKYITRRCAWPDCGREITDRPSRFRHPPERTYCSNSCASLHAHWLRKNG